MEFDLESERYQTKIKKVLGLVWFLIRNVKQKTT
jgi:hypothetical protein